MGRPPDIRALTDEIARFKAEVEHLASELVREIIKQQFDGQVAALRRSPGALAAAKQPAAAAAAARPAKRGAKQRTATPPAPPAPPAPASAPTPAPAPAPPVTASAEPTEAPAAPAPGPAASSSSPVSTGGGGPTPAAPAGTAEAASATKRGGKRVPWTRERIIDELAAWMPKKGTIDAAFMSRHGPPGLVAATRRIFGRFDAALNVVALHVAKMNPEEPTSR